MLLPTHFMTRWKNIKTAINIVWGKSRRKTTQQTLILPDVAFIACLSLDVTVTEPCCLFLLCQSAVYTQCDWFVFDKRRKKKQYNIPMAFYQFIMTWWALYILLIFWWLFFQVTFFPRWLFFLGKKVTCLFFWWLFFWWLFFPVTFFPVTFFPGDFFS